MCRLRQGRETEIDDSVISFGSALFDFNIGWLSVKAESSSGSQKILHEERVVNVGY